MLIVLFLLTEQVERILNRFPIGIVKVVYQCAPFNSPIDLHPHFNFGQRTKMFI